jgi:hypothetical protein
MTAARRSRGTPPKFNGTWDNLAIYLLQSSEASMSLFTPNELTYPATPPAIDAGRLTTTSGEAVRGSGFDVAREPDDVRPHVGLVEALRVNVRAERCDALVATGVMPAGVRL